MNRLFLIAISALLCTGYRADAQSRTLQFSGYEWEVRSAEKQGPGPNKWDAANVSVDSKGLLHLKITQGKGEWRCAELTTKERFGFGRYQFQVIGRIDQLDRNVVLGLFNYPTPDVGTDGTNEIDIEFARWGHADADNGNYTVWPGSGKRVQAEDHKTFPFTLNGDDTTQRFLWKSRQVFYQSLHGHREDDTEEIAHWNYKPDQTRLIPQHPLPIQINLWLFQGKLATDGKEVEIVIKQFTYTPLENLK
jgi:beta-glucanase (GH16 family)